MFSKNKNNLIYCLVLVILFISSFYVQEASASSDLGFSFNSGSYSVGDSINIKVVVSSDKSINAVSGQVSFPKDILTLSSVSKNGSIINLWAQEPSYSNNSGTVSFEGIVLNGFSGSKGVVLVLVFKGKALGTANLSLSKGSILANDGLGTEVISSRGKSIITINESNLPIKKPTEEEKKLEPAPVPQKIIEPISNKEIKQIEPVNTGYYPIPYKSLILILLLLAILLIFMFIVYYMDRFKKSVKRRMITISSNMEDSFSVISRDLEKEKQIYAELRDNTVPLPPYQEEINTLSMLNKEIEDKEKEILKQVRKIEDDL